MYGYTGKSIRIDLSRRKTDVVDTPSELTELFIGGRGMGVALVGKRVTEPFDSPEMPLVFVSGPLVGTSSPTSGRSSVVSRSPLTGTIFDCSVGGRFGTELKRAGFDFVEVTGIAESWVFLDIADGEVRILDAGMMAGKNVSGVRKMLGNECSSAIIGISGEKKVPMASVVFDGHYVAGRGGLGAVMGAKRLKAVRVRGGGKVAVADEALLGLAREEIMRLLRASPAVFGELGLAEFGTPALVDLIHVRRMEPTGNFRKTFFENSSVYSGYNLKTAYSSRKTGCRGCPVLCKKIGENGEVIPEFETVSHFGALNLNGSVGAIVEANRLCNEYGLDTISAAATIACHAEIEDTYLTPGAINDLLMMIAEKQGPAGELLACGSARYARHRGRPELSMSVKGLELPAYDPRGAYGMALAYVTSNRGGCHLRAYPISHEILRKPVATDRFTFEGKARIIRIAEDMNAAVDSLTACKFMFFAASLEEYARALSAVTGRDWDVQSLLRAGERIWQFERYLNSLNGFGVADDDLPERFFSEEGSSSGHLKILPIDRGEFLQARENYYAIRRYDRGGKPDAGHLRSLGLGPYL